MSALWTKTFPKQHKRLINPGAKHREARLNLAKAQRRANAKPCNKVTPKRAGQKRKYNERVPVWLLGKTCVVFGLPATECHHKYGRRGKLLLWEPGWLPVSKAGHDWIHKNPIEAIEKGFFGPHGTWNDQSLVTQP